MRVEKNSSKEKYDRWVKYLQGSVLTEEQIKERAEQLAKSGRDPEL